MSVITYTSEYTGTLTGAFADVTVTQTESSVETITRTLSGVAPQAPNLTDVRRDVGERGLSGIPPLLPEQDSPDIFSNIMGLIDSGSCFQPQREDGSPCVAVGMIAGTCGQDTDGFFDTGLDGFFDTSLAKRDKYDDAAKCLCDSHYFDQWAACKDCLFNHGVITEDQKKVFSQLATDISSTLCAEDGVAPQLVKVAAEAGLKDFAGAIGGAIHSYFSSQASYLTAEPEGLETNTYTATQTVYGETPVITTASAVSDVSSTPSLAAVEKFRLLTYPPSAVEVLAGVEPTETDTDDEKRCPGCQTGASSTIVAGGGFTLMAGVLLLAWAL